MTINLYHQDFIKVISCKFPDIKNFISFLFIKDLENIFLNFSDGAAVPERMNIYGLSSVYGLKAGSTSYPEIIDSQIIEELIKKFLPDVSLTIHIDSNPDLLNNEINSENIKWINMLEEIENKQIKEPFLSYNDVTSDYGEAFNDISIRRQEVKFVKQFLKRINSDRILELGCGTASLLYSLRYRYKYALGLDVSAEMIKWGQKHYKIDKLEMAVIDHGYKNLPDRWLNNADVFLSFLSFRYFSWQSAADFINKILKNKGNVIIIDMIAGRNKSSDILILIKSLFNSIFQKLHPGYIKLKKLVQNKNWNRMINQYPLRTEAEFRYFLTTRYPEGKMKILSKSKKAQMAVFTAENIFNKKLPSVCVLDWGSGGMGTFSKMKNLFPGLSLTYFSDSGFTPYGKVKSWKLWIRFYKILNFLYRNGCQKIIIACNALSACYLDFIDQHNAPFLHPMEIIDFITPVKKCAEKVPQTFKNTAILGGEGTVRSKKHDSHNLKFKYYIGQPLSALLEAGKLNHTDFKNKSYAIIKKIKEQKIILGCTHYPAGLSVYQDLFPDKIFIDPGEFVLKSIKLIPENFTNEKDIFLTTGSTQSLILNSKNLFNYNISADQCEKLQVSLQTVK